MRESDERITSIFHRLPARPPAFYVRPSNYVQMDQVIALGLDSNISAL